MIDKKLSKYLLKTMSTKNCKKSNAVEKLGYSAMSAGLFLLVSLPATYSITNKIFKGKLLSSTGSPNTIGLLLHSIVFLIIVFLLMQPWKTKYVCDENK